MKNIFLSLACLLALVANPVKAAAADPELVVIRVQEYHNAVEMSIVRGSDRTEYLDFKNGTSKDRMNESAKGYYNVLFRLYQEGYVLQSTFTAQISSGYSFTTLVLAKPAKP